MLLATGITAGAIVLLFMLPEKYREPSSSLVAVYLLMLFWLSSASLSGNPRFALWALLVPGLLVATAYAQYRRARGLAEFAQQKGLSFCEESPEHTLVRFAQFNIFAEPEISKTYNLLSGEYREREISAFDCELFVERSKKRQFLGPFGFVYFGPVQFSVVAATLPASCPSFSIRPEGKLDKLAAAVGLEDIDFESDEFSRKFFVKSKDKKFAYAVVNARVMELVLANPAWLPPPPSGLECVLRVFRKSVPLPWRFEIAENAAVLHSGERWSVAQFKDAIELLCTFLDLIPAYVWKDLAAQKETG